MCSTELSQVRCWKSVKVWGVTGVMKKGYKLIKVAFREPVQVLGGVIEGVIVKDFSLQLCSMLQDAYEIELGCEGNKYRIRLENRWITGCEPYINTEVEGVY